jgi:UrcA family protein
MNGFRPSATATAALLAIPMAYGAIPASAAPPSVAVSYADLDLASSNGLERLDDRIRHAARRLCSEGGTRPLRDRIAERRCVADALATAQPQFQAAVARTPGAVLASRRVGEAVR